MKTVISHFYNEEYLLPWWLNHHKKYFDHGIMINYHSNDNSVNLIKEICPTWEIINTKNENFDAILVDEEIMSIEKLISGWRIVLNTTEFLIGDYSLLNDINDDVDYYIPPYIMVDNVNDEFNNPDYNEDLFLQRTHGASYTDLNNFLFKKSRKLSNYFSSYPLGRHFGTYNTTEFVILWYGFSPMNDKLIDRKIQIQHKIPESDKLSKRGFHHFVNREQVIEQFKSWQIKSEDLGDNIKQLIQQTSI